MARCFRIFDCSPVVAEQVLDNMHCDILFELSLLSKKAFTLVQNATLLSKQSSFLKVVASSSTSVELSRGDERIEWHFYGKRDSGRSELEGLEEKTVKVQNETSGVVRELVFAKICNGFYGCPFNCIQDVLLFIQHISSLFNSTVQMLKIHASQFSSLKAIQSVEELKTSRAVIIEKGTVTNVEMHQIIGGFESKSVQIVCNPAPDFTHNHKILISDFRTFESSWFKGPMLLNIDCEHMIIRSNNVSEEDVNKFLHQWMKSLTGCGRIWYLVIGKGSRDRESVYQNARCQPKWNLEKVTHGLSGFQDPLFLRDSNSYRRTIDDMVMKIVVDNEKSPPESFLIIRAVCYMKRP